MKNLWSLHAATWRFLEFIMADLKSSYLQKKGGIFKGKRGENKRSTEILARKYGEEKKLQGCMCWVFIFVVEKRKEKNKKGTYEVLMKSRREKLGKTHELEMGPVNVVYKRSTALAFLSHFNSVWKWHTQERSGKRVRGVKLRGNANGNEAPQNVVAFYIWVKPIKVYYTTKK